MVSPASPLHSSWQSAKFCRMSWWNVGVESVFFSASFLCIVAWHRVHERLVQSRRPGKLVPEEQGGDCRFYKEEMIVIVILIGGKPCRMPLTLPACQLNHILHHGHTDGVCHRGIATFIPTYRELVPQCTMCTVFGHLPTFHGAFPIYVASIHHDDCSMLHHIWVGDKQVTKGLPHIRAAKHCSCTNECQHCGSNKPREGGGSPKSNDKIKEVA